MEMAPCGDAALQARSSCLHRKLAASVLACQEEQRGGPGNYSAPQAPWRLFRLKQLAQAERSQAGGGCRQRGFREQSLGSRKCPGGCPAAAAWICALAIAGAAATLCLLLICQSRTGLAEKALNRREAAGGGACLPVYAACRCRHWQPLGPCGVAADVCHAAAAAAGPYLEIAAAAAAGGAGARA